MRKPVSLKKPGDRCGFRFALRGRRRGRHRGPRLQGPTASGSGRFKIDLAVRDPAKRGRYMLAIECDGATYHSALWARERDRLRQQVLENLGWRFHRIWSTDWFYRRAEQLERLKQVLDAARADARGICRRRFG